MKKNLPILYLLLISLFVMSLNLFVAAEGSAEGLGLDKIITKSAKEVVAVSNPHLEFECTECHKKRKKKKKKKKKRSRKVEPILDVNELCDSCHEGDNLHPVGINPRKSASKIKTPPFLPLGKGKYKKKIVCTTCHDIHLKKSAYSLLRGFINTKSYKKAKFKDRRDLCKACHGDKLIERSPHDGDEKACRFCHDEDPDEADDPMATVRSDIVKRCNICHAMLEGAHFLAVNVFADKALQGEIPDIDLPFIGGEITCVTCHDQHWSSKLPHMLRPAYVEFAEKSIRINPHWTGTFCLSCHDKLPKEGEEPTYLFDGDTIKMCNRCHETEEASANIHPVGIVVSPEIKKVMPEDFKLAEGDIITCETCHDLKYQTDINSPMRKKNPQFLRGGPYYDRSDICYTCHKKESYERMTPHQQLDEDGNVIESKCMFCHSSMPDEKVVGIKKVEFSGDVSEYCYGCHQGKEIKHPVNVTHNAIEPSEERADCIKMAEKKLRVQFPLYEGMLFCGTCHNPHQAGVLSGAAGKG
jgi:hypothetical protein